MARTSGARNHCTGMTDKEVAECVEFQYQEFCRYRKEISNHMPDRRSKLFSSRVFDGKFFELS